MGRRKRKYLKITGQCNDLFRLRHKKQRSQSSASTWTRQALRAWCVEEGTKLRGLGNNGPSEMPCYVTGWFAFTSVKATSGGESLSSYSVMGGSRPPGHSAAPAPGAGSVSHSGANSWHLGKSRWLYRPPRRASGTRGLFINF